MDLLNEGLEKKWVEKTNQTMKLTIDGKPEVYPVYQINLDLLYYNDKNDRVSTWISKYKAETGEDSLNLQNKEEYNDVIHRFVVDSNPDRSKKTQQNIEIVGQQNPGVVLNDGRIIDGNRRFSCLRNLNVMDPSGKFSKFEAVILDKDYINNAKQIKMLELQIQIGEDSKVDYNPIDRLVGVYRDLVEDELLTPEEYAHCTNSKLSEVKKLIEVATLLEEFLDSINATKKYYIARDLDLNGPLFELHRILRKFSDEDKKEEIKEIAFVNFLHQPEKDMTRFIRNMDTITKSNEASDIDEFIEKEIEIAEDVIDNLPPDVTQKEIATVRKDKSTSDKLRRVMEVSSTKVKQRKSRASALDATIKANDILSTIDTRLFAKLNDDEISDLKDALEKLSTNLNRISDEINAY